MIPMPANLRVWLATGATNMRKGMNGLALLVQEGLKRDPPRGGPLCVPGPRRLAGEDPVARRAGAVAVRQAAGPRTVRMADDGRRAGGAEPGAARLHAGGDRLAEPSGDLASDDRGVRSKNFVPQ